MIEPDVFEDPRGYFFESYSARRFAERGLPASFVQDNVSRSCRHTLRGLHLQSPPFAQGKLVYALEGEVLDVAVDVRPGSPTFGSAVAQVLSEKNRRQFYVPPGLAHGFCVISEHAVVAYKCTQYYTPQAELSVLWSDPDLGIEWPTSTPLLSAKDAAAPRLRDIALERLAPGERE